MNSPKLTFYHANGRGTGSAIAFSIQPQTNEVDGRLVVTIANQVMQTAGDNNIPTFPRFDWENGATVEFNFTEVSEIICVLSGMQESIQDGQGLVIRTAKHIARFNLSHHVDGCFLLQLTCREVDHEEEYPFKFKLTSVDGEGLRLALEHSMARLAFGI